MACACLQMESLGLGHGSVHYLEWGWASLELMGWGIAGGDHRSWVSLTWGWVRGSDSILASAPAAGVSWSFISGLLGDLTWGCVLEMGALA